MKYFLYGFTAGTLVFAAALACSPILKLIEGQCVRNKLTGVKYTVLRVAKDGHYVLRDPATQKRIAIYPDNGDYVQVSCY